MTDTTPKACPFCGGEANTEIRHSRIDGVKDRHFPSCLNGDCPAFIVEPYVTYSTKREALTAWNTRANADARLVEALRAVDALLHEHGYEPEGTMRHTIRAALSEVSHG